MGKVTKFYPRNAAENSDSVLEQAIGQYEDLLIIGWNKDGDLDPRSNLGMKKQDILLLIELFKHNLLSGIYDDA